MSHTIIIKSTTPQFGNMQIITDWYYVETEQACSRIHLVGSIKLAWVYEPLSTVSDPTTGLFDNTPNTITELLKSIRDNSLQFHFRVLEQSIPSAQSSITSTTTSMLIARIDALEKVVAQLQSVDYNKVTKAIKLSNDLLLIRVSHLITYYHDKKSYNMDWSLEAMDAVTLNLHAMKWEDLIKLDPAPIIDQLSNTFLKSTQRIHEKRHETLPPPRIPAPELRPLHEHLGHVFKLIVQLLFTEYGPTQRVSNRHMQASSALYNFLALGPVANASQSPSRQSIDVEPHQNAIIEFERQIYLD